MIHHTHCDFHLGDNLFQLHFLRKQAEAHPGDHFNHFAHDCHLAQLREVVDDLPNISLHPLELKVPESIDSWKNAGAGTPQGGFFENHRDRNDYYGFYFDWFAHLAGQMGLDPIFTTRSELLFDYPALQKRTALSHVFDILFVNSQPCSGQFTPMNSDDGTYLDDLINELAEDYEVVVTQECQASRRCEDGAGLSCVCTRDLPDFSVTGIGELSLYCHTIVMIGTGPAWPTMNKFNVETVKNRIVLLTPEHVSGFPNTVTVNDRAEARKELHRIGIL